MSEIIGWVCQNREFDRYGMESNGIRMAFLLKFRGNQMAGSTVPLSTVEYIEWVNVIISVIYSRMRDGTTSSRGEGVESVTIEYCLKAVRV